MGGADSAAVRQHSGRSGEAAASHRALFLKVITREIASSHQWEAAGPYGYGNSGVMAIAVHFEANHTHGTEFA